MAKTTSKNIPADALVPQEIIENKILLIRGKRVMLDRDLAALYGVQPKVLNQAVRRKLKRFPADFMFKLNKQEFDSLRFQFGSLEKGKHSKYLPCAFTEHGILMLSSVLNSDRAIEVNIAIMRVFVRIKELIVTHKDLEQKLYELEHKIGQHETDIQGIFEAIRRLMTPPATKPKPQIGFHK